MFFHAHKALWILIDSKLTWRVRDKFYLSIENPYVVGVLPRLRKE